MPWGYFYVDNPASKNLVFVKDVEVFDASAASKLSYTGGKYLPATVIGTDNNDTFFGHDANETLIGGAGQDSFRPRSGSDTIVSEKNDNDLVLYDTTLDFGTDIMNGFNGEGKKGGDVIQFSHTSSPGSENHPITVSEHNGHTLFDWQVGSLLVDTTGLIKNLDYFIS